MQRPNWTVSNIVTVGYFLESVVDTRNVFHYLPIAHIRTKKRYRKNVPDYGVGEKILSLRHGTDARGLRVAKPQMENICSMDVYVGDTVYPYQGKVVHCKLSSKTCHVTGCKSFEQGKRAIEIICNAVMNAQRMVDALRMNGKREKLYSALCEEYTIAHIDRLCDRAEAENFMLCKEKIEINSIITANGVFEFKVDKRVVLPMLCRIACERGYCVDHANWRKASVVSISIESQCGKFYHRALINSSGAVRLSSRCTEEQSVDGHRLVTDLIHQTAQEAMYIEESVIRDRICKSYEETLKMVLPKSPTRVKKVRFE